MQSLMSFCEWLAETPVSLVIQNVGWIIPTVQTIHILAIAVVMGSVGLLNLRMLGLAAGRQSVHGMADRLVPRVWIALIVLLASGSILAIGEPARSLANPAFQLKMLLLLLVISLTVYVRSSLNRDVRYWDARVLGARLIASASLILWVGIIFAGRWIAYMEEASAGL